MYLVASGSDQAETAARHLARIGYDRIEGYLRSSLTGWASDARPFRSVPVVDVSTVAKRSEERAEGWTLLDVRARPEIEEGTVSGAQHIYVGELPYRLDELRRDQRYTVMCESGARATIAASVMLRAGFNQTDVFLGSMGAWQEAGHPTVKPDQ